MDRTPTSKPSPTASPRTSTERRVRSTPLSEIPMQWNGGMMVDDEVPFASEKEFRELLRRRQREHDAPRA